MCLVLWIFQVNAAVKVFVREVLFYASLLQAEILPLRLLYVSVITKSKGLSLAHSKAHGVLYSFVDFLNRWRRFFLQSSEHGRWGRLLSRERRHTTKWLEETQAKNLVLQGSDLRTGEALSPAEIFVCARARTPRALDQPDAHTSENLVPEPSLQVQETSGRKRTDF